MGPPERIPVAVVLMGVSGSGKTTVGELLAARLGCGFIEGDELHPAENVAKMRSGVALDDESRAPWLARVGAALEAGVRRDGVAVASCSALKRRYRDQLRAAVQAPLLFLWLNAPEPELRRRVTERVGHYMPASLLGSQLADLEPPGNDERWLELTGTAGAEAEVQTAFAWIAESARRG